MRHDCRIRTDQLVGIYTAPAAVPASSCGSTAQLGQAAVTAIAQQTNTTGTTGTVTSKIAVVTVGVGLGLAVTPTTPPPVPAGGSQQFSATLNGIPTAASWTVTSASGITSASVIGSIDVTGLYSAPNSPPPGASLTITATVNSGGTVLMASATVTVIYSDHSLSGPYAFSYTGNDTLGFLAVAGSFVADGNGKIVSGVEDVSSFLTGVSTQVQINGNCSTYSVGSDGRGSASIKFGQGANCSNDQVNTWDFVLTTTHHAQMTRFDADPTGSGTMDEQSLGALSNSLSGISGSYVFAVMGTDGNFNPLAMAGEFSANGSGIISSTNGTTINNTLDVNDDGISGTGTITTGDTTLTGCYQFDPDFPGTGRGTITLESATIGAGPNCTIGTGRTYAFYAVSSPADSDQVIQLHLVEIDSVAFAAGDMFAATTATPGLANATYAFAGGGDVSLLVNTVPTLEPYAAGGTFTSNGSGTVTGGVFDANSGGTYNSGPTINSCSYVVNTTVDRIDLKLSTSAGTCSGSSVAEFAVYQTVQGTALMLEIDSNAVSTGIAYQQCGPLTPGCSTGSPSSLAGSFALALSGQGIFHGTQSQTYFQPDLDGQAALSGTGITSGNLDINNFTAVFSEDPIDTTSSIGTPTNGRGTATLIATTPMATYNLFYYLIDDNTALLFSKGTSPIATGIFLRQF